MAQHTAGSPVPGAADHIRAAERHMARVDLWVEDVAEAEDQEERRHSLERVLSHARAAAEGYGAASAGWPTAEARLAEAVALAALAALDEGAARDQRIARALEACQAACAQVGEEGRGQLSLCAGIWAGCADVLLQVYALSEESAPRRAALEGLIGALGEASGEALLWDRIYRQDGADALLMAQIAQAVAELEEDPAACDRAIKEWRDLARAAGAYLQQTGDWEETRAAYDLIHAAGEAAQAASIAVPSAPQSDTARCPACGKEQPPGTRFCTACGAPMAGEATLVGGGYLVLRDGPDAGQRYPLRDGLTIGRSADNDVVVAIQLASRHHAAVRRAGKDFAIVDLGSSNGTQLNGAPIERSAVLHDGDTIAIGGIEIGVQLPQGAASPAVCPSCRQPVTPGLAFCVHCGARLA